MAVSLFFFMERAIKDVQIRVVGGDVVSKVWYRIEYTRCDGEVRSVAMAL